MAILKSTLAALGTATILAVAASAASSPTTTSSPSDPDVFRVSYYVNETFTFNPTNGAAIPGGIAPGIDDAIYIVNPGTSGGNLCADIYVWDPSEELTSCCSVSITPNELVTERVAGLLTNPASARDRTPHSGVIKIISSAPYNGACSPSAHVTPTPQLNSWMVHYFTTNVTGAPTTYGVTEEEFQHATLSAYEEGLDVNTCAGFAALSGAGSCTGPVEAPATTRNFR